MPDSNLNEPAATYRVDRTVVSSRAGWTVETFDSFEAAELAERRRNHAMTANERLIITEQLRAIYYGYAETGIEPRLERIVTSVRLE